jgi:hypothetical protein
MRYDLFVWMHDYSEVNPDAFLTEYDDRGVVPRVLEIYRTGKVVLVVPQEGWESVYFKYSYLEDRSSLLDKGDMMLFTISADDFERYVSRVTEKKKSEYFMHLAY